MSILTEVGNERLRQDAKWGGPAHDDAHDMGHFVELIEDHVIVAEEAEVDALYRKEMIQVAALAVAAVESLERRRRPRPAESTETTEDDLCLYCQRKEAAPCGSQDARREARAEALKEAVQLAQERTDWWSEASERAFGEGRIVAGRQDANHADAGQVIVDAIRALAVAAVESMDRKAADA